MSKSDNGARKSNVATTTATSGVSKLHSRARKSKVGTTTANNGSMKAHRGANSGSRPSQGAGGWGAGGGRGGGGRGEVGLSAVCRSMGPPAAGTMAPDTTARPAPPAAPCLPSHPAPCHLPWLVAQNCGIERKHAPGSLCTSLLGSPRSGNNLKHSARSCGPFYATLGSHFGTYFAGPSPKCGPGSLSRVAETFRLVVDSTARPGQVLHRRARVFTKIMQTGALCLDRKPTY